MSRDAAGWHSPREASQVPALQGCGTMAGFPERLPCSPRCCVLSPPRLALGHDATQAASPCPGLMGTYCCRDTHTTEGLHVPSPRLWPPGTPRYLRVGRAPHGTGCTRWLHPHQSRAPAPRTQRRSWWQSRMTRRAGGCCLGTHSAPATLPPSSQSPSPSPGVPG